MAKKYTSVQRMLDDIDPEIAEDFRKRHPYRALVAAIRKLWTVDIATDQSSWHNREDFIDDVLPELVDEIVKSGVTVCGEEAKGNIVQCGNLEFGDNADYPMSLIIQFQSKADVNRAIADGRCSFTLFAAEAKPS